MRDHALPVIKRRKLIINPDQLTVLRGNLHVVPHSLPSQRAGALLAGLCRGFPGVAPPVAVPELPAHHLVGAQAGSQQSRLIDIHQSPIRQQYTHERKQIVQHPLEEHPVLLQFPLHAETVTVHAHADDGIAHRLGEARSGHPSLADRLLRPRPQQPRRLVAAPFRHHHHRVSARALFTRHRSEKLVCLHIRQLLRDHQTIRVQPVLSPQ